MKRSILLTLIALLSVMSVYAADKVKIGDLYYYLDSSSKTATVTSPSSGKYSGNITIPSTVYKNITYSVKSIGNNAFSTCTGLTSITIPNSVTSIGKSAFSNCTGLTSITIPNSVTSIGKSAFSNCTGLTSITIPNSVTSIGEGAFEYCMGLTSIVVENGNMVYDSRENCNAIIETATNTLIQGCNTTIIPNSVTGMRDKAFAYCTGLTSVTIPNSVTSIGWAAFHGCTGLTSITIPNSITSIEDGTFEYCTGLTSVTIPNSVTSIGKWAFYNCTGLTSVTIPNSVTSIGDYAFQDCTGLTSVTIGNSVTSIGNDAFNGCTGLTSVTIPNSVTSIGQYALAGCTSLSSITLPNNITSIDGTFSGCTSLTSITLPNSVTSIGYHAFWACTGLTSITIPNGVTSIGEEAFYGCTGLTSVVWNAKKCGWRQYGFASEYYECSPFYSVKDSITSFTFGDEVDSIPNYLCYDMSKLTSITIPNSVTSIGSSAFSRCTGLTSITIPNSVTTIGDNAFYNGPCVAYNGSATGSPWGAKEVLKGYGEGYLVYEDETKTNLIDCFTTATGAITVPNSVTSIGDYAFYNCTGLTSITIPNSVTSIGKRAFYDCTGLTSVTIPNSVTSIGNYAFLRCTSLTSIVVEGGNTVYDSRENCNAIIETATNALIQGCNTTIIPNSVTSIGGYAFSGCTGLTSITIPNSVTSIEERAFSGCTGLTSITIPNSVTSIEERVFSGCTGLTSITIPNSVTSIEKGVFSGCTGLTAITIPNSVTSIGSSAFYSCKGLISITIPNSVTSIGDYAFQYCKGLTSVTIGNSVKSIGYEAFRDCYLLTSITIGNSVTSIGNYAFYGCTALTSIRVKAKTPPQCKGDYTFYNVPKDIPVYVPCDKETYQNSAGWSSFTNIIEEREYSVTIRSSANGSAEMLSYTCDNELTVLATANEHYHFRRWNDGNTENPRTFVVSRNITLTAIFAIDQHSISATAENGRIEGAGTYNYGSTATLKAVANEHYHFTQWSDGNTDNPRRVSVVGDATYTAEFAIDQHNIGTTAQNGRVEGAGTYDYGTTITLTATADEHYHFTQWNDGNTDNPRTISVEGDATYTAVFAPNKYTLSATAENGYVEGTGEYDYGTTTTLTAVANEHYHFERWSDGNTSNPRQVSVDGDATYTAVFAPNKYTISATAENGRVEGMGEYDYATTATLTAVADEHYHFTQWSDGSTDNPRQVSVEGDATYTAVFAPNKYTISASSVNGYVEGTGKYDYGTTATLTATANEHYHFVQWSDGNTDNPRTIMIEGDATYTAEFAIDQFTITATCDIQYGEVTGDGVYDYGTRITLTAIPNSGYEFKQWSNGLTYNPYRFTVVSDLTLEAEFIPATAIDNISADKDTTTPQKVLIDGQVYILRNGKTYTLTGVEVK